ncbi:hypothetical protein [Streptomyces profundus]|nr:hypothetical protein [Streptomyces sp. MA3_2.13]UED85122.1 hypothetical protein K4G22_13710 [Streptomyces sp. MA3_2.13]
MTTPQETTATSEIADAPPQESPEDVEHDQHAELLARLRARNAASEVN